jgi:hypothetical protein
MWERRAQSCFSATCALWENVCQYAYYLWPGRHFARDHIFDSTSSKHESKHHIEHSPVYTQSISSKIRWVCVFREDRCSQRWQSTTRNAIVWVSMLCSSRVLTVSSCLPRAVFAQNQGSTVWLASHLSIPIMYNSTYHPYIPGPTWRDYFLAGKVVVIEGWNSK